MPLKLALALVVVLACSCGAPCTPVDRSRPEDVCRPADAGTISASAPFVLMASTSLLGASCAVSVDGGQVDLAISGSTVCSAGAGFAKPAVPRPVRCEVPSLSEGFYTLNTLTPQSFTLPDAGLPACP